MIASRWMLWKFNGTADALKIQLQNGRLENSTTRLLQVRKLTNNSTGLIEIGVINPVFVLCSHQSRNISTYMTKTFNCASSTLQKFKASHNFLLTVKIFLFIFAAVFFKTFKLDLEQTTKQLEEVMNSKNNCLTLKVGQSLG